MISNTWADGTFGALLSVAYTKRQLDDDGSSTVRWATGNAFAPGFDARCPTARACRRRSTWPPPPQRRLPPALPALRQL